MNTNTLTRRRFLASSALAVAAYGTCGRSVASPSTNMPEAATLLVAGPGGGLMDSWADLLSPVLAHGLFPGAVLRKDLVGGLDGVTAANQFEAWAVPDGSTALLLPGSAAMAWLVGDPRAKFDAARWVPALAAVTPCVVASRIPASQLMTGAPVRIAATSPSGPELPALLALDLLGVPWKPVLGLNEAAAADALAQQQVDMMCLHGRHVLETAQALTAAGAPPVFSFGCVDETGRRQRERDFPELPDASELMAGRTVNEAMLNAWHATAAAVQLDSALVLPQLTPASMVALWRRACTQAAGSGVVQAQTAQGVHTLSAAACATSTSAVLADTAALLELRQWLAIRLDYRPA